MKHQIVLLSLFIGYSLAQSRQYAYDDQCYQEDFRSFTVKVQGHDEKTISCRTMQKAHCDHVPNVKNKICPCTCKRYADRGYHEERLEIPTPPPGWSRGDRYHYDNNNYLFNYENPINQKVVSTGNIQQDEILAANLRANELAQRMARARRLRAQRFRAQKLRGQRARAQRAKVSRTA